MIEFIQGFVLGTISTLLIIVYYVAKELPPDPLFPEVKK